MRSSTKAPHMWVFPAFIPIHIWTLEALQVFDDLTTHTLGIFFGDHPLKVPKRDD